jgi:hypothetical protein
VETSKRGLSLVLAAFVAGVVLFGGEAPTATAVPSFARKYKTSCQTCHVAFPKLNAFGRAFEANGYRFPAGQDPEMVKQERLPLGAEGYKKVFPNAVWPADISFFSPISAHMINRVNFLPDGVPKTEFEFPHELEVFGADTIGDRFSYLAEIEIDEGELGFNGFLQYDASPAFHFRIGGIDPAPVEFTEGRRLTAAHYNYADIRGKSGGFRLRDGSAGLEVKGAINGSKGVGGLRYRAGVVNGDGRTDSNNAKDVFGGIDYKIGGMGVAGGPQQSGSEKPWVDNSVTVGILGYTGKATYENDVGSEYDDKVTYLIGHVSAWVGNLNLLGAYTSQKNDNPSGDGQDLDTKAWFIEGDYVLYPWLIPILRYENTKRGSADAVRMIIPAVSVLARANIRFYVEGQIRLDDAGKNADKYVVGANWAF